MEGIEKENGDKAGARVKRSNQRERGGLHERYFEAVCNLGNDNAFRKEAKEAFSDGVWQREHEDAERDHLWRVSV